MMITRSICNLIDTIVMRTEDRFLDLDTMPKGYPQRAALEKSTQVYNIETMKSNRTKGEKARLWWSLFMNGEKLEDRTSTGRKKSC